MQNPLEANKDPEKILWLIPGNRDFDSTVTLCGKFFAPQLYKIWPKLDQILVSNTRLLSDWPGTSYRVEVPGGLIRWQIERELFLAALAEGWVHDADIIVATEMGLVLMSQIMDMDGTGSRMQGIWLRQKPIFHLSPSVPEKGNQDFHPKGGEGLFWYLLGTMKHQWLGILDNDFEMEEAGRRLLKQVPRASTSRIKKLVCDQFTGFKDAGVKKEDVVVWQGRNNPGKRMDLATEIFALLSGQGVQCEMYVPTGRMNRDTALEEAQKFSTVHQNMHRDEYIQNIARAKVCIVTSESESFATGSYEQVERGAIPVIRKRKWNRTWMTENWPLVWTNTSEAAAMCLEALKNYDSYRNLLEKCMIERWGHDLNFDKVMKEVWDNFIIGYGREFSMSDK